jgi:hypothetical protein
MRFITLLVLFLLVSCGNQKGENPPVILYPYGATALPGSITPLAADYRPLGLSDKVFTHNGKTYAPANLETQDLAMSFDVLTKSITGRSSITFTLGVDAYPYFDLDAVITRAELDGVNVSTGVVNDPDGIGESFVSLDMLATVGTHTLVLEYGLPGKASFSVGGVDFLTSMRDVSNVRFFEHWGPSGFEDDSFELKLKLTLLNSSSSHQIFSNGSITSISPTEWELELRIYFA